MYPTTAGGVGILLHHTISLLLAEGYEVVLLLDVQHHEFERYASTDRLSLKNGGNLHVYSVEQLCDGYVFPKHAIPHSEILRSARIAVALEKLCSLHPVELVEFYDYCGPSYYFMANNLARPPAIAVRLHNTVELIARKIRSTFDPQRVVQFAAERQALQGADLVLSPGQSFYDKEIVPLYPEAARDRVHMSPPIHRPVGTIDYSPLARDVVFYGRLSTFKGLDTFIKGAVLALRDRNFSSWLNKFIIMGPEETVASTYTLDEMKGFIPDELKSRFEFTGRVNHVTLMERLQNAAFACFANRMESFCYAAHELHTAGVPLILSDTPAFRDHFTEGETALFFDATAMGLAARMAALAGDLELRIALSKAGLARGESYLVDHYAQHLEVARALPQPLRRKVDTRILILADGNAAALSMTIASLRNVAPLALVLHRDSHGAFRFGEQRWRIETVGGGYVDPVLTMASEAVLVLRAGDKLDLNWFEQATSVMGFREQIGSLSGWLVENGRLLMRDSGLLPEGEGLREPGLRTLIRIDPRETLQDALRSRPGDGESAMILARRAKGMLALSLPLPACDVTSAVSFQPPSREETLRFDFDRFSRDYLTQLILNSGVLKAEEADQNRVAQARSRDEPGYVQIIALKRGTLGGPGGNEVLFLRFFPTVDSGPASWNALQLEGDWLIRQDPGGPVAGALRTESGRAQTYLRDGAAIDVLVSPWSGGLEITYGGRVQVIDLYGPTVEAVRLVFAGGEVKVRNVMEQERTASRTIPNLRMSDCPELFIRTGQCDALVLAARSDDFATWPHRRDIAERTMVLPPSALQAPEGEDTPLLLLARKAGVQRLVLSSRLAPTQELKRFLASLPASTEIAIALCGAADEGNEGRTPLAQIAAWEACLTPYIARLTVLGGPPGLRGFFAALGAKSIEVPRLRPPVAGETLPDEPVPVSIALISGELKPDNLMHMLDAIILAVGAGLDVDTLYLPESYRNELRIFDEVRLPISVAFFNDVASLVFVGGGTRRIAMGCFPQESLPHDLVTASTLGWLPMAGAASEFDSAPGDLAVRLSEPYWENSAALADRLMAASADYAALSAAFAQYAAQAHAAGQAAVEDFFLMTASPASEAGDVSAPLSRRKAIA